MKKKKTFGWIHQKQQWKQRCRLGSNNREEELVKELRVSARRRQHRIAEDSEKPSQTKFDSVNVNVNVNAPKTNEQERKRNDTYRVPWRNEEVVRVWRKSGSRNGVPDWNLQLRLCTIFVHFSSHTVTVCVSEQSSNLQAETSRAVCTLLHKSV